MNYSEILDVAYLNLKCKNATSRIVPTQSAQVLHFQTFLLEESNVEKFEKDGEAKTIYAIDYIVKFKPENMHDIGHYLAIMFKGEKIFERKRTNFFDIHFYKVQKDFLKTYNFIKKVHSAEKLAQLEKILEQRH